MITSFKAVTGMVQNDEEFKNNDIMLLRVICKKEAAKTSKKFSWTNITVDFDFYLGPLLLSTI
jgi:hypothetical protein